MYLEPFDARQERKRMNTLALALFAMSIVTTLVFYELYWVINRISPGLAQDERIQNIIAIAAQYGVGFVVCVLIMKLVKPDPMEQYDMSFGDLFRFFCIAAFFLYAGDYLGMLVNDMIGVIFDLEVSNVVEESFAQESMWYSILTSVILAPIVEEVIFRKLLLDRINRYGDSVAMATSGLLFGLYHGNFTQFFYAAWVGFLFAYIYLRTGKIRYTIGIHMALNAFFGVFAVWLSGLEEGIFADVMLSAANSAMLVFVGFGLASFILRLPKARYLKGWLDASNREIGKVILLNVGMILLLILLMLEFVLNIIW